MIQFYAIATLNAIYIINRRCIINGCYNAGKERYLIQKVKYSRISRSTYYEVTLFILVFHNVLLLQIVHLLCLPVFINIKIIIQ